MLADRVYPSSGKWYYEVCVLESPEDAVVAVGWADRLFVADYANGKVTATVRFEQLFFQARSLWVIQGVGDDTHSWAFVINGQHRSDVEKRADGKVASLSHRLINADYQRVLPNRPSASRSNGTTRMSLASRATSTTGHCASLSMVCLHKGFVRMNECILRFYVC